VKIRAIRVKPAYLQLVVRPPGNGAKFFPHKKLAAAPGPF
jgi:hypothetical protein